MRILAVSDREEPQLFAKENEQLMGGLDLILSCGDLPPEYLSKLTYRTGAPLYFIKGNHDIRYTSSPPAGCIDIHAKITRFNNYSILGLEGSRWYNGGPYQYTEAQMRKTLWLLRPSLWRSKGVDIVISHAPPRHIHDAEDLCHRGFKSYHWLVRKYAPEYFIHGHIHRVFDSPSERTTMIEGTRVVNAFGYHLIEMFND
jgi:Icc-related predicted phosphoesterase